MLTDTPLLRLFNVWFVLKMAAGLSEDVFPPLTLLLKVRKVADKYFKGNTGTYIFVGQPLILFIDRSLIVQDQIALLRTT